MTRRTWITRLFAAAVTTLAFVGSHAQAGLLPTSVTITPDGGNYRWTYAIVLPTDMKLQSGNYFTIYDFAGYIPGGEMSPEGWTLMPSASAGTPDRLKPNDDPGLVNLTWMYTGETIPDGGKIGLGNFWAYSSSGNSIEDSFAAETGRTSDGLLDRNITDTLVPLGGSTPPPGVPEPATLALAGLGLPLVGLTRMIRRKK